ncbi:MAG TPA: hypothetical protein DCS93_22720 [Microscillaceae bacterium]|nr:hypothetical protein [Microscillaceae bacterium]
MRHILSLLICTCLWATIATTHAQTIREDILYIKPNGQSYLYYTTLQARGTRFYKAIPKTKNFLQKYLYIKPDQYQVTNRPNEIRLNFNTDSYALMSEEDFHDRELTRDEKGTFTFDNDTINRAGRRRYGIYTTLSVFKKFAYVWVLPENFEFVSYKCNREGRWKKRGNTLAYFGYNVNSLLFNIQFRPVSPLSADDVRSTLYEGNSKDMRVTSNTSGVQINFRDGVLFADGSTSVSALGERVLVKLAKTLKSSTKVQMAIEVPVTNGMNAGNWMLAAAQGRMMVEKMVNSGVEPSRIEIKTYGMKKGQSSRGIEIQLINAPKRKQ